MAATADQIAHVLRSLQYHAYVDVAGLALVIWDYILTFPEEFRLVWAQPKNWVTILYALNRYLVFFELVVSVYGYVRTNVSEQFCTYAVAYWLVAAIIFHLIVSDSIVWLCVSALYGHGKKIRYPLLALQVSAFLCSILLIVFINDKSTFREPELPSYIHRCIRTVQLTGLWTFWLPILTYELTTLGLVAYKYYIYRKNRENFRSDLLELVLRSSMVYLSFVCIFFSLNCWLYSLTDQNLTTVLTSITLAICSVSGNRMLLNLRAQNERNVHWQDVTYEMTTTVRFAQHEEA